MKMIKINKNVPVPKSLWYNRNNPKYPFRELKIGDSLLLEEGAEHPYAGSLVATWRRATGWKFTTRKLSNGRIRVWRIRNK